MYARGPVCEAPLARVDEEASELTLEAEQDPLVPEGLHEPPQLADVGRWLIAGSGPPAHPSARHLLSSIQHRRLASDSALILPSSRFCTLMSESRSDQ